MALTHHDGVSVYGSGLWVGKKPNETCIMTCSGIITNIMENNTANPMIKASALSGVPSGKLTTADGAIGIKLAGGTFGFSGWLKQSCSTGLTSIKWIAASERMPCGFLTSGYYTTSGPHTLLVDWSGGTFDIVRATAGAAGTTTSAAVSGSITWIAMGT